MSNFCSVRAVLTVWVSITSTFACGDATAPSSPLICDESRQGEVVLGYSAMRAPLDVPFEVACPHSARANPR